MKLPCRIAATSGQSCGLSAAGQLRGDHDNVSTVCFAAPSAAA